MSKRRSTNHRDVGTEPAVANQARTDEVVTVAETQTAIN